MRVPDQRGTTSYRVVIGLKRGVRTLRRADQLMSRDILNRARILILEFALTAKKRSAKKVFDDAQGGPLKEVSNGEPWPAKGPACFKRTLTSILSKMQVARAKEKRFASGEALFEENQKLQKKNQDLEEKLKRAREETDRLRKKIKNAKDALQ